MSSLKRFLRSKAGITGIFGMLAIFLISVLIGQQVGWFKGVNLLGASGTSITLPPVTYPDPTGGYTCLPTCVATDGKFLYISNPGMDTFSGEKLVVWLAIPGNKTNFELGVFDGDSGKDNAGAVNPTEGNWDDGTTETSFTLYADPLKDGTGKTVIATWQGNNMPNNNWFTATIQNVEAAKAPSRNYFYRLEASQPTIGAGGNSFKLRTTGYLVAGQADLTNSNIGFMGSIFTQSDINILYPQGTSNLANTTYDGRWQVYIYNPLDTKNFEIWDGDFDRGTIAAAPYGDTNDPDSPGIPSWVGNNPTVRPQGAQGQGRPPDDNLAYPILVRSPSIEYNIVAPSGATYLNDNPSGTEEWEKYWITTDPANTTADQLVSKIEPGFYTLNVIGLDLNNLAFLRTNQETCDPINGCGPCTWPGCNNTQSCPRTIGYWKNNVYKVYVQNRTNGVQESKETIDWALKALAMKSQIFRHGLVANLTDPNATTVQPIADPTPLDWQEANTILQKTTVVGNSMLGRALQQNLGLWLNLASGKISDMTVVVVNVPSGTFQGTMMDALLKAEDIMINGGNIELAKDIADMINNGQINVDPGSNVNGQGEVSCTLYSTVMPNSLQPLPYDLLPRASGNGSFPVYLPSLNKK